MGIYCKGPFPQQRVLQSQICIYERTWKGWPQGQNPKQAALLQLYASKQVELCKAGVLTARLAYWELHRNNLSLLGQAMFLWAAL